MNVMRYEITSKYGWSPGKRALRTGEEALLLLHVDGFCAIEVATGALVFSVIDRLKAEGATEYKYDGPGLVKAEEPAVPEQQLGLGTK